jgi:glycogen debranching enzyme
MSATHVHEWLKLDVAARQKRVRQFYGSNSPDLLDDFLGLVRAPHGYGVYASIGPNYQYAIFGRDSVTVADDLLGMRPALSREIILLLAHLQGSEFDMQSEQEEGKIHHEYRSLHFNNHDVSKAARLALERLGPLWGGTTEELLYYGTYDATPLYVRLVSAYCQQFGDSILGEVVHMRNGTRQTIRQSMRAATGWLVSKITASPWQLYEFRHLNPAGLVYQAWQDSSIAYLHEDGTTANADSGIAAIELQGYAHDALYAAAELVADDEDEANAWRHLASIVRDATLGRLWTPRTNYFSMGLDRANNGGTRQITTLTANPGLLLASDLFDRMPHDASWPYIEGIVRMICSEELLTVAGLRLRGHKHANMVAFADYHGSLVTWPHQTVAIARGLRRHGFYTLATILENCVLQSVGQAGEFYEFFFVDRQGRAKYHYRNENPDEPSFHDFGAADLPEPAQAWTLSAILRVVATRHNPPPILPVSDSVRTLEAQILSKKHIIAIAKAGGLDLT